MSNTGTAPILYCSKCGSPTAANAQICSNCGTPMPVNSVLIPSPNGARYGGFWMRFLALIIDRIVVGVVTTPFVFLIMKDVIFNAARNGDREPDPAMVISMLGHVFTLAIASVAVSWLYEAWLLSSDRQATVGKMAVGLKVTDLNGQRISFARATGRFFAKIVSSMTLLIGFIMAAFTERKQALHDMMAGTIVLKSN
jgi:uncharacterized RDD family membrane protein YckC